jgi:hypothetical protein
MINDPDPKDGQPFQPDVHSPPVSPYINGQTQPTPHPHQRLSYQVSLSESGRPDEFGKKSF